MQNYKVCKLILVVIGLVEVLWYLGPSDSAQPACLPWERTFGGKGLDLGFFAQPTVDGGFIAVGVTTVGSSDLDAWLIKMDASGNNQWEKTFGGKEQDIGLSVRQTREGGFIIIGETQSFGAGKSDVWLIKTDAQGNKQWERTFGGRDPDGGTSVRQLPDESFILLGWTQSAGAGQRDVWVIKTDAKGNQQWARTFGGKGLEIATTIELTRDGGFIFTGITNSFGAGRFDLWMVKVDRRGTKEWEKTFGGSGIETNESENSMQQTDDGGYVLVGYTLSSSPGGGWLIKTDTQGNKRWEKIFQSPSEGNFHLWSIRQTADSGFIVLGGNRGLIKTDAQGKVEWEIAFEGDKSGRTVELTREGGFLIAGSKGEDLWLRLVCPPQ